MSNRGNPRFNNRNDRGNRGLSSLSDRSSRNSKANHRLSGLSASSSPNSKGNRGLSGLSDRRVHNTKENHDTNSVYQFAEKWRGTTRVLSFSMSPQSDSELSPRPNGRWVARLSRSALLPSRHRGHPYVTATAKVRKRTRL